HLKLDADTTALGARTKRGVERERARLNLFEGEDVIVGTCALLGIPARFEVTVDGFHDHEPVGEPQRRLDRVGEPLTDAVARDQTVHDYLDGVFELLLERRRLAELHRLPIDPRAREALLLE